MYTLNELKDRLLSDLKEVAEQLNVGNFKRLSKQDLIYKILDHQALLPADQLPGKKPALAPAAEAPAAPTADAPADAAPARGSRGGAGRRRPAAETPSELPFSDVAAPVPAIAKPDEPVATQSPTEEEAPQPTRLEKVEADEEAVANVSVAAEEATVPPTETNPTAETHSADENTPPAASGVSG